jgi:hypothetical protein
VSIESIFTVLLSVCALLVSIVAIVQTSRFNARQNEFAKTADEVNKRLIAQSEADIAQAKRADLIAKFENRGRGSLRLQIRNIGRGIASNVQLQMLQGEELLIGRELDRKFPYPALRSSETLEVIGSFHNSSPRRAQMKLTWQDEDGGDRSEEIWADPL